MRYHRENNNVFFRLNWTLVLVWAALAWIGIANIYSALYVEDAQSVFDLSLRSGRQALWFGVACVLAVGVFLIKARFYWSWAGVFYVGGILLVLITLAFGKVVNGSKSWLSIGGMSIQPIEFLKASTALMLAKIISGHDFTWRRFRCAALACGAAALPMGLALVQKDTGSAMVFVAFIVVFYRFGVKTWIVFLCVTLVLLFIISLLLEQYAVFILLSAAVFAVYVFMSKKTKQGFIFMTAAAIMTAAFYYVSALLGYPLTLYTSLLFAHLALVPIVIIHALWHRVHYLLGLLLVFAGAVVVCYSVDYVFDNILKEHQRNRINVMLGITEDLRGAGYNVHQSKITIGSGGFAGKGFLSGTQTKYNFVPEQSTDFIFCTIGEEWGFLGALVVVGLFFVLLVRIILLAERQRSRFVKVYGYCTASILFFHAAVNLGMTIGLFPVIGIPLPFISYGGSSMWAFSIMLFVLLRMDAGKYV